MNLSALEGPRSLRKTLTARMTVSVRVIPLAAWRASNARGAPAMLVAIRLGARALMVITSASDSERARQTDHAYDKFTEREQLSRLPLS